MAASASNTTTVQYPIWIDEVEIYCDEAKLKHHLTHKLNYNENDAARIFQQISGHIEQNSFLYFFWWSAAEEMSTEAIRVLLHSIEHSQLIRLLSYQDGLKYTALRCCAGSKRNEVIKVILDSVSEKECYQLLSITDDDLGWTPLHVSCMKGDTESVRLMLNHINQDMRYSLLQMPNEDGDTPLYYASYNGYTDVIKLIHESVTHSRWINLLQRKYVDVMTVLQTAAYENKQSCIDTIRDSVSDEEWLQLVSTPLPEYNQRIHYELEYHQAVSRIDELRAAARVKCVLLTQDKSGI